MDDGIKGYELAYGSESSDGTGVKLFVRRKPETLEALAKLDNKSRNGELTPKERERCVFSRCGEAAYKALHLQEARLDPKRAERETTTRVEFMKAFADAGLSPIFIKPIPNEYWGAESAEAIGDPWYLVTTSIGHIKIGWRKRVINIDWGATILLWPPEAEPFTRNPTLPTGEQLFPKEDTTRGDTLIHAWSMEKATQYLKVLANYPRKG